MTDATVTNNSVSKAMYAAGWKQGRLFSLPQCCFLCNSVPQENGEAPVKMHHRPLKAREILILVSQDCDIVSDAEPYIEAMICKIKDKASDQQYLDRVSRNSARAFVVDRARGIVAYPMYRVVIDKQALALATLDPWEMDQQTLDTFKSWLARRFDRPAIPDNVYEGAFRPLYEEFGRLEEAGELLSVFSAGVREVRIQIPENNLANGYRLLLILDDGGVSSEQAEAVQVVADALRQCFETKGGASLEVDIIEYSEVLYRQVQATQPLFLDYLTEDGREAAFTSKA